MNRWPDEKIRSTALWYIGKHTMNSPSWRYTLLGNARREVFSLADLQSNEMPVVSFFLSTETWYLFTTRRVLGSHAGRYVSAAAIEIVESDFGHFKRQGETALEVMTLRLVDGTEIRLQYETFLASMAPIYYFRYWKIKYPILDKLKG